MNPLNPYFILGVVLAALALLGIGYGKGHHDAAQACEVQRAADREQAQQQKDAEAARAAKASTQLEVKNAEARIVYQTITKQVDRVVERPVYRAECFDPDGLRLVNAALTGKAPDPGQPDRTVPRPADAGQPPRRADPAVNH